MTREELNGGVVKRENSREEELKSSACWGCEGFWLRGERAEGAVKVTRADTLILRMMGDGTKRKASRVQAGNGRRPRGFAVKVKRAATQGVAGERKCSKGIARPTDPEDPTNAMSAARQVRLVESP
jgi:hypothetical protein